MFNFKCHFCISQKVEDGCQSVQHQTWNPFQDIKHYHLKMSIPIPKRRKRFSKLVRCQIWTLETSKFGPWKVQHPPLKSLIHFLKGRDMLSRRGRGWGRTLRRRCSIIITCLKSFACVAQRTLNCPRHLFRCTQFPRHNIMSSQVCGVLVWS